MPGMLDISFFILSAVISTIILSLAWKLKKKLIGITCKEVDTKKKSKKKPKYDYMGEDEKPPKYNYMEESEHRPTYDYMGEGEVLPPLEAEETYEKKRLCFWHFAGVAGLVLIGIVVEIFRSGIGSVFELLLYNTTLGSLFSVLSLGLEEGFSFSPGTLVAVGFSGFLGGRIMEVLKNGKWYTRFLCSAITIAACAVLTLWLSGLFDILGGWGWKTLKTLMTSESSGLVLNLLKSLLVGIIGIIGIVLFLMTLYEYYMCICYGIFNLTVCTLAVFYGYLAFTHYLQSEALFTVYVLTVLFATIVLTEYERERHGTGNAKLKYDPARWFDSLKEKIKIKTKPGV